VAFPTRVNTVATATWTTASGATFAAPAQAITAGNTILVAVGGLASAGQTVTGIADTAGNTYTKIAHAFDATDKYRQEFWYASNVTGHATNIATVTWSAALQYRGIVAVQYAGLAASPLDGFATGTAVAGNTTVTTGTLTTTRYAAVHLLIPRWGLADTVTYPTGFGANFSGNTNALIVERFTDPIYVGTYTITHTNSSIAKVALAVAFAPVQTATAGQRVTQMGVEVLGSLDPVSLPTALQVTQAPVEVLSLELVDARVTQYTFEVLHGVGGWKLFVAGVEQTAKVTACSIRWTLNERTRASVVFNDYLPDRLAEIVIYARNGVTKLFGGVILSRYVQGYTQRGPDLKVTCECGDWFAYADWVTVSAAYPESTLKTVLTALVNDYLDAYGITLNPAQVDGPTIAPVTWNQKRVSDALREVSNQAGYFLRMSPEKVLTMAPPGDEDAPDEWTLDTLPTHVQEVEWRDLETVPANKVTLLCGPNGLATIADEHHWGDGSTRIFPLNSPYVAIVGALRTGSDSGGLDPGGFPVGTYGVDDMPWTYDASLNAMRQRTDQPILAADEYIMLWYSAQFPFTVEADTGETPVIEYHEARPELLSIPAAQAIAEALLANMSGDPLTLHGRFNEDHYEVGQLLTVSLSAMRQIAGTFTIRTITLDMVLDTYWQYSLEATEGAIVAPSSLVGWRKIMGEGYAIPGPWETPPAVRSGSGTMPSTIISAGTAAALGGPAFLGGTREGIRSTGTAWEPVSNYIDYYAGVTFSAIVRADLFAAKTGVTVKARLWNLTQGRAVGESIVVQSTTPVPVVFPVAIEFGNKYRLEKQASGNNEIIHALGTLEAT
jgi:hypothetical protein